MATALMQNDDLSMNRFNPYTWTGTFGVSSDGSHNWQPDGTYTVPWDTSAPSASDRLDTNQALKHFDVMDLNNAGNMWMASMPGKPTAPFPKFPARKYEGQNGDLTWVRPDINFNYVYDKDFIGSRKLPDYQRVMRRPTNDSLLFLILLAGAAFAVTRLKK
jgi:hypothetical protein